MKRHFKLHRVVGFACYDYSKRQEVFEVVAERRTPGISHWRGKYSHLGWLAFRGTSFNCKFIKGGLTKRQAITTVLDTL